MVINKNQRKPQVTLEDKEPKRTNGGCFFKLFISPATLVNTSVARFFTFMKTIEFQFLGEKKLIISVLVPNINGTGNPISDPAQKQSVPFPVLKIKPCFCPVLTKLNRN
jgi:hypothetical protein